MAIDARNGILDSPTDTPLITSKDASRRRSINGDLNNTSVMRFVEPPIRKPAFAFKSLAPSASEDDSTVRMKYRPFLLSEEVMQSDWISKLELATVTEMAYDDLIKTGSRLKVLVLYGSLRKR